MATLKSSPTPSKDALSTRSRTILTAASTGLSTYGMILQFQDANTTGADDEIGSALQIVGEVFRRAGISGQISRNDVLKAIADEIYTRIGLTPVESE